MAMNMPTIYDEFSFGGEWWIAGEEEHKISGVLQFTKDQGIILKLFGSFEYHRQSPDEPIVKRNVSYQIIHGDCFEGMVTLINGFSIRANTKHYPNENKMANVNMIKFDLMLTGIHVSNLDEFRMKGMSVNFSNLEMWLLQIPFETIFEPFGIKINETEKFDAYVEHLKCKIESSYTIEHKSELYEHETLIYKPYIFFHPDEPQNLNWFMETIVGFKNLLSILMNTNIFIKSIEYSERHVRTIHIYPTPLANYDPNIKVEQFNSFVINPFILRDNLSNVLDKWYSNKIESSILMYLRTITSSDMLLEDKFLSYAKAIESIHRETNPNNKFVEEQLFNETVDKMLSAVKDSIDVNLYNKLRDTLKYANEHGFQRRIKESINVMPDDIKPYVLLGFNKIADFADVVRKNRDYYTHFGSVPDCLLSPHQFFGINRSLKLITLYLILRQIGISDEIFLHTIQQEALWLINLERDREKFA
ncbi:HEPN domain-containing protein [Brevibacillus panacihumi]|uniref:ApeA N-terminal domain 1-containing protein n=1 Tax=Brevibacillus panacihumi TaxID=497735 RepID=UPI003D09458C